MNLDKLKELARDSEADEWESEEDLRRFHGPDAAYIAAASPKAILALIEVAEKANLYVQQIDAEGFDELRSALARLHGGQD